MPMRAYTYVRAYMERTELNAIKSSSKEYVDKQRPLIRRMLLLIYYFLSAGLKGKGPIKTITKVSPRRFLEFESIREP